MQQGKTLWLIILLKLIILFLIIKPFFFPDILKTRFHSDDQRAAFVFQQLNKAASTARFAAAGPHRMDDAQPSRARRDNTTR